MSETEEQHPLPQRGGVLWVEFKGHRRGYYANPFEFPFRPGDIAIVEADRGEDAGLVKTLISPDLTHFREPEYSVIRRATIKDRERITWLRERENEARAACEEKARSHRLQMKLVDAEYRFDGLKLIFYFTADGRVDFRDLVRDLAGTFRTRIELRQIGARDEVKRQDGYGVCGYRLCCVSYLNSFQPITTHMAKTQNLILNPSKLSGLCGKLKCCLGYEYDLYEDELASEEQPVEINNGAEDVLELEDLSD